jgi:hypothetical protein
MVRSTRKSEFQGMQRDQGEMIRRTKLLHLFGRILDNTYVVKSHIDHEHNSPAVQ